MIVAGPEGFLKNQYRKFNIKSEGLAPGDDYGMMREVLERRFKRLLGNAADGKKPDKENDDAVPQWPDLVIIDGGQGQLNAARQIFTGLNLTDVSLIAVAKGPDRDAGRETLFMPDRPRSSSSRAIRCCISSSGCATSALFRDRVAPQAAQEGHS
jgi:excinuclease ABC subunit C